MKLEDLNYKIKGVFLKSFNLDGMKNFDLLDFHDFNTNKYPFLLESSARGNNRARFSILFCEPEKIIIKNKQDDSLNFLSELDTEWKREKVFQEPYSLKDNNFNLPFLGGWFIYLGYELAMEIEKKLSIPESPYKIPTALAARVKSAIIYDQLKNNLYFFSESSESKLEEIFSDFKIITEEKKKNEKAIKKKIKVLKKGTDEQHQKDIKTCIEYIFQGEIFQANLSRLWEFNLDSDVTNSQIYKELRRINPSPFAGLIQFDEGCIISSSPERLVSVKNKVLETRPIAGTRPRGSSGITDVELIKELIDSEKERAEHLMLVDLERNDISRVCKSGTVEVDEMMVIESYSHVHHIVSNIKGKLKDNINPGEIISAVFPGGTITGCPKVRCMEILGELEKIGRGPYTGSFGYITHSGDLDLNIIIRSMVREEKKISLRAGGGIVADSIPEKETLETEAKVNAMLKALQNINN